MNDLGFRANGLPSAENPPGPADGVARSDGLLGSTALVLRDPFWASARFPAPLRVDLGAGQSKKEGFIGLDRAPVTDIQHDLLSFPWPFADDSVAELHASHILEHFWGEDQARILEEAYRVLAWEAGIMIIVPWWNSARMWQDPTHKAPFPAEKVYYFNKSWRTVNKLDHYGYKSDFDLVGINYQVVDPNPQSGVRGYSAASPQAQAFAVYHYANVVGDLTVVLKKVKRV